MNVIWQKFQEMIESKRIWTMLGVDITSFLIGIPDWGKVVVLTVMGFAYVVSDTVVKYLKAKYKNI